MRRHRGRLLAVGTIALLTLSGCGSSTPDKLTPAQPDAPLHLCSLVPSTISSGLSTSDTNDQTGNPTAACSMRSAAGAATTVRAVVTFVNYNDEGSADDALASQCRAIDPAEFKVQQSYPVTGADKGCAGSATTTGDSASLSAAAGSDLVTVRMVRSPKGSTSALADSAQIAEAVIKGVAKSDS